MKAIILTKYGSPDVLKLQEFEKPVPKDNEVLVRVHASALNNADIDFMRGFLLSRLAAIEMLKNPIIGTDIAGRVEAIGSNVTQFQVGDEVYGDLTEVGFGAFAEYVAVPEKAIAHKPRNLSFIEAAAVPTAGILALQSVRDYGNLQAGEHLLINGAGGGVGTFALQLAHYYGAKASVVDKSEKFEMLTALGAVDCIDYRKQDYTRLGKRYDLVIDVLAKRLIFDYPRVLSEKGRFGMVGGSLPTIMQGMLLGNWLSGRLKKKVGMVMVTPNQADLITLRELIEAGHLRPIIHQVYPLADIAEAFTELEAGKACGKIVIQMEAE
jgi:NADPH:quinone reductase-like Zn-dependent oxidoreductase